MSIRIVPFNHDHVAHRSYLLVDAETGTAAVIDPYRAVDPYLAAAHDLSARIRHILLTQQHDDFHGGQDELRDRTGATLYAGAWSRPPFDFFPVKDGDVLEFGRVRLQILEIPGHRLEGIAVLVFDLRFSPSHPVAVFTGDTLTLGDVGLPEPRVQDGLSPGDFAKMLHHSIREKILTLPPFTRIYPALAEAGPDRRDPTFNSESLLETQLPRNPVFRPMNVREFEVRVLAGMVRDPFPRRNGAEARLRGVSATELLRAGRAGAQIVDVRSPADFAAVHLQGAVSVPIAAAFETWVGAVLDPDKPLLLVAPPGEEQEAAARLGAVGVDQVAGFLQGGMEAMEERSALLRGEHRYSLVELEKALQEEEPPQLVEIGRRDDTGCALKIPLEDLRKELGRFSPGREVVVCSETSFRTSAAASFLRSRGVPRVRTLAGGLALWGRRPTERRAPRPCPKGAGSTRSHPSRPPAAS